MPPGYAENVRGQEMKEAHRDSVWSPWSPLDVICVQTSHTLFPLASRNLSYNNIRFLFAVLTKTHPKFHVRVWTWLGLCTPKAESLGSIPGWALRPHKPAPQKKSSKEVYKTCNVILSKKSFYTLLHFYNFGYLPSDNSHIAIFRLCRLE